MAGLKMIWLINKKYMRMKLIKKIFWSNFLSSSGLKSDHVGVVLMLSSQLDRLKTCFMMKLKEKKPLNPKFFLDQG